MKIADISVELIDACGSDLSVVNAARVSFEKVSEEMTDKDAKLISYLARHKHTSPFNHCFASFRVKAPIFVARQLVKHKFLPWNEVSRRYVDSEPEFFIPEVWRKRAENVKQGSSEEAVGIGFPAAAWADQAIAQYEWLMDCGVCPEQARMVLPQNTMTEWIWSGTLGAWADMCRLRLDPHAQYETRLVAEKISLRMQDNFPVSWDALMKQT
jgi:thymidylate synthase (FAD)